MRVSVYLCVCDRAGVFASICVSARALLRM